MVMLSLPECLHSECPKCGTRIRGWMVEDIGCDACTGLTNPPAWALDFSLSQEERARRVRAECSS